jgi:hypothetical protein
LLNLVGGGVEALEVALDAERRQLMRANERRLHAYKEAARDWAAAWPDVARATAGMPLQDAHALIAARAEGLLPFDVP